MKLNRTFWRQNCQIADKGSSTTIGINGMTIDKVPTLTTIKSRGIPIPFAGKQVSYLPELIANQQDRRYVDETELHRRGNRKKILNATCFSIMIYEMIYVRS